MTMSSSTVLVRYKGLSGTRIINPSDLAPFNIGISQPLIWERRNHWKQAIRGISDELLQILKDEGTFIVEEVNDDNEIGNILVEVVPAKLDDTGTTVVDATTGQVSVSPDSEADGSNPDGDPAKASKRAKNSGQ